MTPDILQTIKKGDMEDKQCHYCKLNNGFGGEQCYCGAEDIKTNNMIQEIWRGHCFNCHADFVGGFDKHQCKISPISNYCPNCGYKL